MANEEDYNSLVKLLGRSVSTLGPCPLTLAGLQRLQKIDEHEFAIRSAVLDRLRLVSEAELREENFRRDLQEELALIMNETLEQFENYNFAAVESVYFIGFVVQ